MTSTRKCTAILLALSLMLALLPLAAGQAEPVISVTLDKTAIKAGDTLTATYSITDLPAGAEIMAFLTIDDDGADSKELTAASGTVSFMVGYGKSAYIDIICTVNDKGYWESSPSVTVTGSPEPITADITLSKTSANPGDTVTVSWNIKGGVKPMVDYVSVVSVSAAGSFEAFGTEDYGADYNAVDSRTGSASGKISGGKNTAYFRLFVSDESIGYNNVFPSKFISVSGSSFTGWLEGYDAAAEEWGWAYFQNSVAQTGWKQDSGKWYYLKSNYVTQSGWLQDGGNWYYFDWENGAMQTGWIDDGGDWYYADASGVMQTGWLESGGSWYYLGGDGLMRTGWVNAGGAWYYMNEDGVMQTGWVQDGGAWYYMSSSGAMKTGWVNAGGAWYYMNSSGAMKTGWLQEGSSWYYLTPSGSMATGEYTVDGTVSVFNASGVWVSYK